MASPSSFPYTEHVLNDILKTNDYLKKKRQSKNLAYCKQFANLPSTCQDEINNILNNMHGNDAYQMKELFHTLIDGYERTLALESEINKDEA